MAPDAQENGNEKIGRMPGEPSRSVLADLGTGPNSSTAVMNGGKIYEEEAQREWDKLAPLLRENGDREKLPLQDAPVTPAKDTSSSQLAASKLAQDSIPRPGPVRKPSLDRIRDSKTSSDSTPVRALPSGLDEHRASTAATGHIRSRQAQRHTISEHVHDGLSRRANKALEEPPDFLLAADDPPTHATIRRRSAVPRIASSPALAPRNTVSDEQRATVSKKEPPGHIDTSRKDHNAAAQPIDRAPSPMPQSFPLPPLSIPTYLQLELSSERPSPLYVHRSATADFPYESSQVKMERLINFLVLPLALEQVLWFGALTCLDAWLYLFTILPLRFARALYILMSSWVVNLNAEIRFICGFIIEGVGRVYRRRLEARSASLETKETPKAASSRRRDHPLSGPEGHLRAKSDMSRRSRQSSAHKHRRQKSVPSALLPDDKADILKGLLTIATCIVLMRFDASRMYHWIRGQAAIKLYVIYNVLEVGDRLLSAIGQDVLECLFSKEALERKPNGRSKVLRPFWLFHLALAYTVLHAMALFYQVITLNVAVNSYSNALITLLLSNQFVEIKSTVFKKFEKENLFQLTCADVVERFQLWLMLTIIASRNIVETGVFSSWFSLGSLKDQAAANTNSTPLTTPPKTSSSILPQSFTFFPSSLLASLSGANSIIPTMAQVLGPFLIVLGSEMLVDWLKHAYINKFNNTRPTIYGRFLDVLAKDYYVHAFADQNLTRRLGLPVIPLACLFFRVSVQTYQMFLASCLPTPSGPMPDRPTLSTIREQYSTTAGPSPSTTPNRVSSIMSTSLDRISSILSHAIPSPAHSVTLFTILFILISYVILLLAKLGMGMALLSMSRARYKAMKDREREYESSQAKKPTAESHVVEGHRRVGGWGTVEVNDDKRRWIYVDDPNGLRKLREREERDRAAGRGSHGIAPFEGVKRYEMAAKRIW